MWKCSYSRKLFGPNEPWKKSLLTTQRLANDSLDLGRRSRGGQKGCQDVPVGILRPPIEGFWGQEVRRRVKTRVAVKGGHDCTAVQFSVDGGRSSGVFAVQTGRNVAIVSAMMKRPEGLRFNDPREVPVLLFFLHCEVLSERIRESLKMSKRSRLGKNDIFDLSSLFL